MPDWSNQPIYKGSVKDIYPFHNHFVFAFSDRYSIFDWGEMPDLLPQKGAALATLGDLFFRALEQEGIAHHSQGLIDETGKKLTAGAVSSFLMVNAVAVPRGAQPGDYRAYQTQPTNTLVPLEVVFRFGVPAGSSLFERLDSIPGYAEELGLKKSPRPGDFLEKPIVEFFTKLEPTDRFLAVQEARSVAGLNSLEQKKLTEKTLLIANSVKNIFSRAGIELWDGKFEFAFADWNKDRSHREFILVDSIGPDEMRLLKDGVHLSKEILRRHYRDSDWFQAIKEAKETAFSRDGHTLYWKKICKEELKKNPAPLPKNVLAATTALYPALTNAVAMATNIAAPFANAWPLEKVITEFQELT